MSATVPPPQAATGPQNLGELVEAVFAWIKKNLPQAILSALLGAAFGYAVNFLLLAFWYDGFQKSSGGMATGQNNVLSGSLFWGLGSTILFSLYGYRRAVGKEKFWHDVRNLPATVGTLFQQDGHAARIHLLWGAAVSLFASQLISPSLAGVMAIGLLASAPSLIGRIFSTLLYRAWLSLMRQFSPGKSQPLNGPISMTVGLLGTAAALGIAFFIDGWMYRLVLAIVCAVIAWTQGSPGKPAAGIPSLLVGLGFGFLFFWAFPSLALANDSGVTEDGGVLPWIKNGGPMVLAPWALPGSAASALGAAIGMGLGNILGGLPGGPLPGSAGGPVTTSPPPITDPWTGKPLTTWQPGQYGPGSDGNSGGPGMVWWGGNWVDPSTAQQAIADSQAADVRRAKEDSDFANQSQQMIDQATHDRAVQLQAEADAEAARQAEINRREQAIEQMRDNAPASESDAINRILSNINQGGPTPENLAAIRALTNALGAQAQGQSESEAASSDNAAAEAQLGETVASTMAQIGQYAAGAVENTVLPGSRGFFSSFLFGALGARDQGLGAAVANGSLAAVGSVISGVASEATASSAPLNIATNMVVGAGVAGDSEIIKGSSPEQIRKAAEAGALLSGLFSAASNAEAASVAAGGEAPGASVPNEGPVEPGGPRPYTDEPLAPKPDPSIPNEGPVEPGGPRPFTSDPEPGHEWARPPERADSGASASGSETTEAAGTSASSEASTENAGGEPAGGGRTETSPFSDATNEAGGENTGTSEESSGTQEEHTGTSEESSGTQEEHTGGSEESSGTQEEHTGTSEESSGTQEDGTGTSEESSGNQNENTGGDDSSTSTKQTEAKPLEGSEHEQGGASVESSSREIAGTTYGIVGRDGKFIPLPEQTAIDSNPPKGGLLVQVNADGSYNAAKVGEGVTEAQKSNLLNGAGDQINTHLQDQLQQARDGLQTARTSLNNAQDALDTNLQKLQDAQTARDTALDQHLENPNDPALQAQYDKTNADYNNLHRNVQLQQQNIQQQQANVGTRVRQFISATKRVS